MGLSRIESTERSPFFGSQNFKTGTEYVLPSDFPADLKNGFKKHEYIVKDPESKIEIDPNLSRWRNAPAKLLYYKGDSVLNPDTGIKEYEYPRGRRLEIGSEEELEEVMDSAEEAWSDAAIDITFDAIDRLDRLKQKGPRTIKFLELGFGMGFAADRAMLRLVHKATESSMGNQKVGEYRFVELNQSVYYGALRWMADWEKMLEGMGIRNNITITPYPGEAGEVTRSLMRRNQEEGKKRKFDIILSDTCPIIPDQRGLNDFLYLDQIKYLLESDGMAILYPYIPQDLVKPEQIPQIENEQWRAIHENFSHYQKYDIQVSPPKDYKYLHQTVGGIEVPVRALSLYVCSGPKFDVFPSSGAVK